MKSIKISAIIMSLIMVCCLCLSCLEGSAGGSPIDSLGGNPIVSASERGDSGSGEQDSSAGGSESEAGSDKDGENDSGKEDETEECAHELQRGIVVATCTTVGRTVETCKKNCGYKKVYNKFLPSGHNIVEGVCVWCKKAENEIEWYEFKFHWAVGDDSKVETFKLDKQTEDIGEILENKAWDIAFKHREESPSLKWAIVDEFVRDRSIAVSFKDWNGGAFDYYKHMGQPGCGDGFGGTHYMIETDCPGVPHCSVVGYRYGECERCHYKAWLNNISACGHQYVERGGEEICSWCGRTKAEIAIALYSIRMAENHQSTYIPDGYIILFKTEQVFYSKDMQTGTFDAADFMTTGIDGSVSSIYQYKNGQLTLADVSDFSVENGKARYNIGTLLEPEYVEMTTDGISNIAVKTDRNNKEYFTYSQNGTIILDCFKSFDSLKGSVVFCEANV